MNLIIGAHGVGKTTLLNDIKNRNTCLTREYFITDAFARPIRRVSDKYNLSKECVQDLNTELMLWATDYYLQFDKVLSSRSLIDSIVYTKLFLPNFDLSNVEEKLREIKKNIKYIFYIPIEFELKSDGVRFPDIELQKNCDKLLLETVNKFSLNDKLISLSGTPTERLVKILKYL